MKFSEDEFKSIVAQMDNDFQHAENKPDELYLTDNSERVYVIFNTSTISYGMIYYLITFSRSRGYFGTLTTDGMFKKRIKYIIQKK